MTDLHVATVDPSIALNTETCLNGLHWCSSSTQTKCFPQSVDTHVHIIGRTKSTSCVFPFVALIVMQCNINHLQQTLHHTHVRGLFW